MFGVYRKIQTEELIKMPTQYSGEPIECKNCHKHFTPIHPSQVFCCRECAKEHYTQKKVTKSEEKFNRGRVYSLDMSSWNWKKTLEKSIEQTLAHQSPRAARASCWF